MKFKVLIAGACVVAGVISACGHHVQRHNGEDTVMHVEVVSLQGCGATPPTIALIRETAAEMKITIALTHTIVTTAEEAAEHRHIGSPTVRVNGLDIDPDARGAENFGVT